MGLDLEPELELELEVVEGLNTLLMLRSLGPHGGRDQYGYITPAFLGPHGGEKST